MSAEVRQFQVTTPAGTLASAPLTTSLAMPARIVEHLRIRVPPGPRGNLGFAVAMAGVPVIPVNVGTWIIADDERFDWDLENLPDSGAWQLLSYNVGKLPHSVFLTFSLGIISSGVPTLLPAPLVVTA